EFAAAALVVKLESEAKSYFNKSYWLVDSAKAYGYLGELLPSLRTLAVPKQLMSFHSGRGGFMPKKFSLLLYWRPLRTLMSYRKNRTWPVHVPLSYFIW